VPSGECATTLAAPITSSAHAQTVELVFGQIKT
jgi:hypothetical protein